MLNPSLSYELCENLGYYCRDKYLLREREAYDVGGISAEFC